MVGRADGGSFSIECFVSFEPLRSTSEDESLISLLAGDGQRFTALDIGRRTQRGIEIAARCCTWSSDASPFYGPFDISACRACRRRAQNYYSCTSCANRSLARHAVVVGLLLGTLKARGRAACHCPIPNIPCPSIHSSLVILQILVLCTTPERRRRRIR